MIQVIVHLDGLDSGSMMLLRYLPHLRQEYGLDIRIPYAPTRMFREIRYSSRLISLSFEDKGINVNNVFITLGKTLWIFIPVSIGSPNGKLEHPVRDLGYLELDLILSQPLVKPVLSHCLDAKRRQRFCVVHLIKKHYFHMLLGGRFLRFPTVEITSPSPKIRESKPQKCKTDGFR